MSLPSFDPTHHLADHIWNRAKSWHLVAETARTLGSDDIASAAQHLANQMFFAETYVSQARIAQMLERG